MGNTEHDIFIEQNFLNPSLTFPAYIAAINLRRGIEEIATKYAKGDLIDLGCGVKPYRSIFCKYVESYFGVDLKETASSNYAELTSADLYADICDTGLPGESFETLLSTQVLEHIYDTKKYLNECFRLLRKGGGAIFTVPQTYECHAKPYDYYRFTEFSLKKLFDDHGFKVVELYPLEGAYAAMQQLKIVSVILGIYKNKHDDLSLIEKVSYKLCQYLLLPYLNIKGIYFDKFHPNKDLCLNYMVVAIKQ